MFSIGFKSVLRGGIFNSSELQQAIASRAVLLFWDGSPSCSHSQFAPLPDRSNMVSKCRSMKDAKYCASIFSYLSQITTPFPWLIATIILATFPPVPALRPLAKHPVWDLRIFFSTLPLGGRAWSMGFVLWTNETPSRCYLSIHSEGNWLASLWRIPLSCLCQFDSCPFLAHGWRSHAMSFRCGSYGARSLMHALTHSLTHSILINLFIKLSSCPSPGKYRFCLHSLLGPMFASFRG